MFSFKRKVDLLSIDWDCFSCNDYLNNKSSYLSNFCILTFIKYDYLNLISENFTLWNINITNNNKSNFHTEPGCKACGNPNYPKCKTCCQLFEIK